MEKVQLHIGDVVNGIVKDFRNNYAMISLGNITAFLPSSEYAWHKDCTIKNVLKKGDEITAVVVIISGNDIVLSIKRLKKNPWKEVNTNYVIGQMVKGKVIKVLGFGAFIELEDGLQGLLHKSEMSTDGKAEPSSILVEDQEVEVEIITIEADRKRMAFSNKHL